MHAPRLMIAGTHSGCGKTTAFCAVAGALRARGLTVTPFKCGPDYIDPLFHAAVCGASGGNADSYFAGELLAPLFAARAKGINLLEGAMGFLDGAGGSEAHSAKDVARRLSAPAVLVVDCRGAARSVLPVLEGFERAGADGFLLNNASAQTYAMLAAAWKGRARLYGYLPRLPALPSRHLGLVTAGELPDLAQTLERFARAAEETVDLDGLLSLAESAPPLDAHLPPLPRLGSFTVAAARDEAFCFWYPENVSLFERLGARFLWFSPLRDELPPADMVWLSGGYPELYKGRLSANVRLRAQLRAQAARGVPVYAECGGFLYLLEALDGVPMAGLLSGSAHMTSSSVRFGYAEFTARRDCIFAKRGDVLRGHEFHYCEAEDAGDALLARGRAGERACFRAEGSIAAGFPHLYFYSNTDCAVRLCQSALRAKEER